MHWETHYKKLVKEPSCIRKPDTGQQADRLSCFESGAPTQTKASTSGTSSLGPLILCHVSHSCTVSLTVTRFQRVAHVTECLINGPRLLFARFSCKYWGSRFRTQKPVYLPPCISFLIHDGSIQDYPFHNQTKNLSESHYARRQVCMTKGFQCGSQELSKVKNLFRALDRH